MRRRLWWWMRLHDYVCRGVGKSREFLETLGVQIGAPHSSGQGGSRARVHPDSAAGTYVRRVQVIKGAIKGTHHQEEAEARCRAAATLLAQNRSMPCLKCSVKNCITGTPQSCKRRGHPGHRPVGGPSLPAVPITNGPGVQCHKSWRCTTPLTTRPGYAVPGVSTHVASCNTNRALPLEDWSGGHVVRTLFIGTTGHMSAMASSAQWGDDGGGTKATAKTIRRVVKGVVTTGEADIFAFVNAGDQFEGIGNWTSD